MKIAVHHIICLRARENEGREEHIATQRTKSCRRVNEYQCRDKPSFTTICGRQWEIRDGPSTTMKKNKEQEIVPGFLSSTHSPSSTYKGPPAAQRTVLLQCITSQDGTQASGAAENEARTKAYQTQ